MLLDQLFGFVCLQLKVSGDNCSLEIIKVEYGITHISTQSLNIIVLNTSDVSRRSYECYHYLKYYMTIAISIVKGKTYVAFVLA